MYHNVVRKAEGNAIFNLSQATANPITFINEDWYKTVMEEKLYNIPIESINNKIDEICNSCFEVDPVIGETTFAPNDKPYITYCLGVGITRELAEDTFYDEKMDDLSRIDGVVWDVENGWKDKLNKQKTEINIIHGIKIYLLECMRYTLENLASDYIKENGIQFKPTLYWRKKPVAEFSEHVFDEVKRVIVYSRFLID